MAFFTKKVSDWLCKTVAVASIEAVNPATLARQSAIKDVALYTAVGLIADITCECERQVFKSGKLTKDGTWYRWNISANENQSASELITKWIFDIYYDRRGGLIVPIAGRLHNADSFSIEEHALGQNIYKSIVVGNESLSNDWAESNVYHIDMVDYNGYSVRNLIDAAFAGYAELLSAASDSYTKASGEKYIYKENERMAVGTPEQEEARREQLKSYLSSFINAKTAVYPLTKEQDLTKLSSGSSASSTAYSDLRKDIYAIVAEILHLPASLLDGNMNNTSEVVNQALTFAIGPLCDRLGKEITRKTFTQEQIASGSLIRFDTTQIRVRDVVDTADKLDKLISSGIMCIDEVRGQCNLPPLGEDWSQKHYITKNYEEVTHELEGGE